MLNVRFSKALTASSDWSETEARMGADDDWAMEVTGHGASFVDWECFFTSIFEVVDIWCYGD